MSFSLKFKQSLIDAVTYQMIQTVHFVHEMIVKLLTRVSIFTIV